jgi:predicted transcriptional regulator
LLERLESKGYVRRDRSASVHVFAAAVGRDELIGRRLRSIADKLCGGSLTPLLSHLIQSRSLSARERQSLRELIENLDTQNRSRRRPRD